MEDRYLLIYDNGMTHITESRERAQKVVDDSKGMPYRVFFVKTDKEEAVRLIKEGLTTVL